MHLFLAPHPDDAPLSCGATIYQLTTQGERVVVLTLMAGDAPDPLPDSPLVQEIHARWGLGANPFTVRRAEDQRAVEYLGAEIAFGEWLDCIYRTDEQGRVLYSDGDAIFGEIHPADPLRLATLHLSKWADNLTHLYVPLAAGNHVDHQLVRELALTWVATHQRQVAVFFYGEYPYTSEAGEVLHSHTGQADRLAGVDALHHALSTLPLKLSPELRIITEESLARKIEAIACYQSQISSFWESTEIMAERVRHHAYHPAQDVLLAERFWTVK